MKFSIVFILFIVYNYRICHGDDGDDTIIMDARHIIVKDGGKKDKGGDTIVMKEDKESCGCKHNEVKHIPTILPHREVKIVHMPEHQDWGHGWNHEWNNGWAHNEIDWRWNHRWMPEIDHGWPHNENIRAHKHIEWDKHTKRTLKIGEKLRRNDNEYLHCVNNYFSDPDQKDDEFK